MVPTILSLYQRKEMYEIQAYKHRCSVHNCHPLSLQAYLYIFFLVLTPGSRSTLFPANK